MVTTPVTSWGEALLTSMAAALALFLGAIPKVIGFLVILIIGWLIAAALAKAVAGILRAVRFNDLAQKSGFTAFVQKMGVKNRCGRGAGRDPGKWFVRLIVLVVAFDALGLPAVSEVLQQLLLWLPNLVVALVVLVIAGLAANALSSLVRGASAEGRALQPGDASHGRARHHPDLRDRRGGQPDRGGPRTGQHAVHGVRGGAGVGARPVLRPRRA